MKYKDMKRHDEVLDNMFPYFEILGYLEENEIDWTTLEPKLFDAIYETVHAYSNAAVALERAKWIGKSLRLLRKIGEDVT